MSVSSFAEDVEALKALSVRVHDESAAVRVQLLYITIGIDEIHTFVYIHLSLSIYMWLFWRTFG